MDETRKLRIYLHRELLEQARKGKHRFLRLVDSAVSSRGWGVSYHRDTPEERLKSAQRRGKALFHMDDPYHDNALTFRLAYYMPFWQIEKSAKRWEWDVAQAAFDAREIDKPEARQFYRFWSKRLFGEEAIASASKEGFVYIPLQGRLLDDRSFQAMSPAEMILATLDQEPELPIVLTLHPKETYSEDDMTALAEICDAYPRVIMGELDWLNYLAECNYVVTQNSSAAVAAMFFQKPSVLFGRVDFHHICGNVWVDGVEEAFRKVREEKPNFKAYLKWFFQDNTINAGKADVNEQILVRLRRHDWEI
jgi:hypothetical protein